MDQEKEFQPKIDTKSVDIVPSSTAVSGDGDDDDDGVLIAMGYKPELKREFSYASAFGQAWGSQGLAPSIAGSLIFALGSGGSVAAIWTWVVGCILLIPVALALGEMGSRYLCLALILAMAIATPSTYRNSAKFVFVDFQNTGYWANNG
ncbi:unnamed protein product [Rotaria sp. Silwood1]|nr:unnamed protein product [Rotaria sp. Silwood1]CAF4685274.1 unnamed protein product [Rotaria sp. Silwood1]CAF4706470.1 unnamed protein product [Rotaria sp. Silwood1]